MKVLTYEQLLDMNGQNVYVVDDEPAIPDVICKVVVNPLGYFVDGVNISKVSLVHPEWEFEYDLDGNCIDGEFTVFLAPPNSHLCPHCGGIVNV